MSKTIVLFILIFVVSSVFYYSWLPDPSLKTETYLPNWLLDWSNYYYNLRTAIPFVALGFLLETFSHYKNSNILYSNKNLIFLQNLGVATFIACIAEGGQFLIRDRNPDLMDVYFGVIGSLIGGLGFYLVSRFINFKKKKNAK